jgi:hypothetical protein
MFTVKYPEKFTRRYMQKCPQPWARLHEHACLLLNLNLHLDLNLNLNSPLFLSLFANSFQQLFQKSFASSFGSMFDVKYQQLWVLPHLAPNRQTLPPGSRWAVHSTGGLWFRPGVIQQVAARF